MKIETFPLMERGTLKKPPKTRKYNFSIKKEKFFIQCAIMCWYSDKIGLNYILSVIFAKLNICNIKFR